MKKLGILVIFITLMISLTSCNQKKLDQLSERNGELSEINTLQDSLLNDFMMYFNEFEDNLEMIKDREAVISMSTTDPEFQEDRKDKVLEDIQLINSLLVQNRSIIDSLTHRLDGSQGRVREFRRTIARLNKRMDEKSTEVQTLKVQLEEMDFTVASLNARVDTLTRVSTNLRQRSQNQVARIENQEGQIQEQSEKLAFQTKSLNTAFYVTGTSKELKAQQVIDNTRSKTISKTFDPTAFTKIDITSIQEIPLEAKKAKLLTIHPIDSYVFQEGASKKSVESLKITNPEKFWSTSKYLVVVVD